MKQSPEAVVMATLRRALSLKRPYGSREEGYLLASLVPTDLTSWIDSAGNLHVDLRIMKRSGVTKHRTLFVAHVDTVHRTGGINRFDDSTPIWRAIEAPLERKLSRKGKPVINAKTRQPVYVKPFSSRDNALGADDGAGVAILAGLIAADVPGYYVFTRGEECGGIGAKHLADEHGELLAQFDRAIAFDRRSTWSVITHQGWGRCCSNEFADALSDQLNLRGMMYMPDDSGVYTDTAEFVDLIPECTNLSVGYEHEHSDRESLDTQHLMALFEAARTIEWDALPTRRDPNEPDDEREWGNVLATTTSWATRGKTFDTRNYFDAKDWPTDDDRLNDPFYVDDDPHNLRKQLLGEELQ